MEGIFKPKKNSGATGKGAKQSSLLATDVFRKIEPGNPLGNAPEEMKQQEKILIQGVAENPHGMDDFAGRRNTNAHHINTSAVGNAEAQAQFENENNNNEDGVANDRQQNAGDQMISFELTTCLQMAFSPENRLGLGCSILNDFFR